MRKLTAKDGQDLVTLIQRNALAAGQAYDRQGQAFEAERQAEVALLEKAIELARPGLASVSDAIESAGAHGRHARGAHGGMVRGDALRHRPRLFHPSRDPPAPRRPVRETGQGPRTLHACSGKARGEAPRPGGVTVGLTSA